MVTKMWVNIGSGNGLMPDGTKPLPEPVLTDHYWSPMTFILGQFHKKCLNHQSLKSVWNYISKISFKFPRDQWVNTWRPEQIADNLLPTFSIPWLLIPWLCTWPGHQKHWRYWLLRFTTPHLPQGRISPTCTSSVFWNGKIWNIFSRFLKISQHLKG